MNRLAEIIENPGLRNRKGVFADRVDAGHELARLLQNRVGSNAMVLAIPAGGVPVARVIADDCHLPLGLAVAKKMLLPWNTECGFGAVAFDGSEWINDEMVLQFQLTGQQIERSRDQARTKVQHRLEKFCNGRYPQIQGREVILVDDGLASGATLYATIAAINKLQPARLIIAVPTASENSARRIAPLCDLLVCANIRSSYPYAVAAAFRHWDDVDESELPALLK